MSLWLKCICDLKKQQIWNGCSFNGIWLRRGYNFFNLGKFYLLIYYQLIDANLNKMNFSSDGKYNVWDVNTSTMIANLDLIASLNWKKFCFQNSIFCKYRFYKDLTSKGVQELE